ncbi:MAG: 50S ribosomal protein L3 [bacterium]
MTGILGQKIGMTRVYGEDGRQLPVTVLEVGPCVVIQRKTVALDGYDAVQLGFKEYKAQRANQPSAERFKKAGVTPRRYLREFRLDVGEEAKPGDVFTATMLKDIKFVDVTGVTKGRGFQGVVKRHGMRGGPASHGSTSKRRVGAVGCRELPGRIHKNKRMPGHMGHVTVTMQNLKVVQVLPEDNLVLVLGAVPGPTGSLVYVMKALKKATVKS